MTREEEIRTAVDAIVPILPSNNGRTYEQALIASGVEAGIKWADENPKSLWISVKDDLPCNHEELISLENPDFTISVLGRWSDEDLILPIRMTKYLMEEWKWEWELDISMDYWMPIPELPKQNYLVEV